MRPSNLTHSLFSKYEHLSYFILIFNCNMVFKVFTFIVKKKPGCITTANVLYIALLPASPLLLVYRPIIFTPHITFARRFLLLHACCLTHGHDRRPPHIGAEDILIFNCDNPLVLSSTRKSHLRRVYICFVMKL